MRPREVNKLRADESKKQEARIRNVCPLLSIAEHRQHKCVCSRCAYWNRLHKKCSVAVIGDCMCITDVSTAEYLDIFPDAGDGSLEDFGEEE